jgi:DNA-binding NtrC family response regulator/predicted hydrocarbon binding protein
MPRESRGLANKISNLTADTGSVVLLGTRFTTRKILKLCVATFENSKATRQILAGVTMKRSKDHVSLADIMRRRERPLPTASSDDLQLVTPPTIDDLAQSLLFTPGDGRIWLNDQRMVLLHASALGAIRRELVETIGHQASRALLTRVGYTSGAKDAEFIRSKWPNSELATAFNAGPRLHCLEGFVKVTPVRFEFDVDQGKFFAEFLWHDSSEAAEYIATYGIGSTPACWMQLGYASGYASAFLGKLMLYREVECMAMGAPHCRLIGRPADEWPDADEDLHFYGTHGRRGTISERAHHTSDSSVVAPLTEFPRGNAMIGLSAAFRAARHMLTRVAPTDATVLFTGESGVGKELFSKTLHDLSLRKNGPFVAVNCAAIPESLIESELFGVERGAYTGATASRAGRFERASGGTLFLDEVGCLSMVAQSKLLRVLQEGEAERVGGSHSISVDIRVVAATNVNLRDEVRAGRFREDLFYRLNVFPVELPALRDRRDDIPLLMEYFLDFYAAKHRRKSVGFTRRAVEALLTYDYPGNIREMQNLIERGVICAGDEPVDIVHMFRCGELSRTGVFTLGAVGVLQEFSRTPKSSSVDNLNANALGEDPLIQQAFDSGLSMQMIENKMCAAALARCEGNVAKAARLLGWTRAQLDYHLTKSRRDA